MAIAVDAGRRTGAHINVRGLSKAYGSVRALADVDLEIRSGEFLALLGPSGSGKTTLLMSLAGFEQPTSGSILMDGADVVRVPAHKRNLGMMFQRYALFPHLNVRKNIEYPLKVRGMRPSDRRKEVTRALDLVSLAGYENRRVAELSGGQQQRVALARAIVFSPTLLLMDEPLGALDQQLREQVQLELRSLHRRLGATIVFVTHDQKEAMTMADRIAVMDNGMISQVGTPRELYERPHNRFVASFIGEMNFIAATAIEANQRESRHEDVAAQTGQVTFHVPASQVLEVTHAGDSVVLAVRPHHLQISDARNGGLPITVEEVVFRGSNCLVIGVYDGQKIVGEFDTHDVKTLRTGDTLHVSWAVDHCLLFNNAQRRNPTSRKE